MNISLRILVTKLGDGSWFPVLGESPECPTPVFIAINSRGMRNLSEQEWIEKYKVLNNAASHEFKFIDIGIVEF